MTAVHTPTRPGPTRPSFPTSCVSDADCDANAYCNAAGACVPDEPNGQACTKNSACQNAHCQNGFCCDSGNCCAADNDCNLLDQASVCNSVTTCQGTRVEGVCQANFQCTTASVDDDSGCAGQLSDTCGPYPSIFCSNGQAQPSNQSSLCPAMCTDDTQCDASAHCSGGTCQPDSGPGGFCTAQNQCGSGLTCVDSVCCTSACNGACQRCDLSGNGTCSPVPSGQDPDQECGAVSCSNFYAGFSGDSCLTKADVPAAQATCNGAGACKTQAQECTAQVVTGPAQITCDHDCQDPTGGTCTGMTPGQCTNVSQGNQTCGQGVCQVTVPVCLNGSHNTCVPNSGAASTETCDDIDNNCDGTIDNGAFSDGFEGDDSCASFKAFPAAGSDQSLSQNSLTVYPTGDVDYYRIDGNETDSSCACCDFFCTDEDYQLTITLSVPASAGSYSFCTDGGCGTVGNNCQTVAAGTSASWVYNLDGGCPGNDNYSVFIRVMGSGAPGFECSPYTISYFFDAGRCLN